MKGQNLLHFIIILIISFFIACSNNGSNDTSGDFVSLDTSNQRPIALSNKIEILTINQLALKVENEPIYISLPEGDSLKIKITSNYPIDIKIVSYVEKKELIDIKAFKKINQTIFIPNTDIYSVIIKSTEGNYADILFQRIANSDETINYDYLVSADTVVSDTKIPNSTLSTKYKFENIFKQPRKVTVNSSGKKDLTGYGENKVYVPVDLPKGTKEWIYRLNLSYREKETETSLYNDVNSSWSKVNKSMAIASNFASPFSGILVNRVSNITNTAYKSLLVGQAIDLGALIFDEINKVPKEEAYINYYIIKGENNAKKFTEGKKFDYKLTSSQKNIQSTDELEKQVVDGQIFIGFENTNMREQVYVQLELISIVSYPVYVKVDRKLTRVTRLSEKEQKDIKQREKRKLLSEKKKIEKCAELKMQLENENIKLTEIESYHLLRTSEEKQTQIDNQNKIINDLKKEILKCNN